MKDDTGPDSFGTPRERTVGRGRLGLCAAGVVVACLVASASACNGLLGDIEIGEGALTPGAGGQVAADPGSAAASGLPVTGSGGVGGGGSLGVGAAGSNLDGACQLGAVQCVGAALQLCSPDGTRWITNSVCGSAQLCKTDPPGCQAPACALDQLSCEGAVLRVCNPNRDGWVELETCASAAHCSPSARQCLAAPCKAGDLTCNQEELQRCADDELGWVPVESCATQALCELARTDAANACPAPACEAGDRRCVGPSLQRCNDGRTDFELVEECDNTSLCQLSLANGSAVCESPRCSSGEHRCAAERLTVCNPTRTGFDDEEACDTAALCDPRAGACQPAACQPGARRCNGPVIETCNADRTAYERAGDEPCANASLCIQNPNNDVFCRDPVCSDGQFNCTRDGLLQRCSVGRDAFDDVRRCDTPQLCDASLGPQGCKPAACASGERRCQGTALLACRTGRDGLDKVAECGSAGCDGVNDVCRDPCVPGRPRCTGSALEECTNPLLGWQLIDTCSARETCDADARRCQPAPAACAPNERRCQDGRLEECNEARTGFDVLEECASAALCVQVGNGNNFRCEDPACGAGEAECRRNGTLAVCNAGLDGFDLIDCGLLGCNDRQDPPECRTLFNLLP